MDVNEHERLSNITLKEQHIYCYSTILHFTFVFSLFVFVSAAGHYFRIWTDQVPVLF